MLDFKTEENRIYAEDGQGKVIAEVLFPIRDGVADIEHTFVDDSLRGQGIAGLLVKMAVQQIRAKGLGLTASCSYAAIWLKRHPEYGPLAEEKTMACNLNGRH